MSPQAKRQPRRAKPKSSPFKDEHRAKEIEALLPKLEAKLSDHDAFARDPAGFDKSAKRIAAARAEKDAAEMEWLEIEEKREALGA